jgi:hypothetical protein
MSHSTPKKALLLLWLLAGLYCKSLSAGTMQDSGQIHNSHRNQVNVIINTPINLLSGGGGNINLGLFYFGDLGNNLFFRIGAVYKFYQSSFLDDSRESTSEALSTGMHYQMGTGNLKYYAGVEGGAGLLIDNRTKKIDDNLQETIASYRRVVSLAPVIGGYIQLNKFISLGAELDFPFQLGDGHVAVSDKNTSTNQIVFSTDTRSQFSLTLAQGTYFLDRIFLGVKF